MLKWLLSITTSQFLLFTCITWGQVLENGLLCKFQEFRCEDGSGCLLSEKLCNGVEDCPGGEDENGNEQWDCSRVTLGTSSECGDQRNYFKCRFGGCIPRSQVCDGVVNCWGASEEAVDLCGSKRRPAPPPTSPRPIGRLTTTTLPTIQETVATTTKPRPTFQTTQTPPINEPIPRSTTTVRPQPPQPPRRRITTTPTTTSSTTHAPQHSIVDKSDRLCPPIELDDGQDVNCYHSDIAQVIDCKVKSSPTGTRAHISCKKFWTPPQAGSRNTEKVCMGGKWVGGGSRRFRCDLGCGEGGYPPVALVAGGITSTKGKWPWHAGLYESDPPGSNNFNNICGATLISQSAVITAGHCVTIPHTNDVKNTRDLLVFLGKYYRSAGSNDGNVQALRPLEIKLHPDYNYANLDCDIAIIWLEKRAEITSFVHPICMPYEDDELSEGESGLLTGWGSIGDRVYPEELQEAELPFVGSSTCRRSHSALNALVSQRNFCAGHKNGTSACDGDSGGGLAFSHGDGKSKWVLQGIVSGGVPKGSGRGCDPNHYVAFTKVGKFRSWIDRVLDNGPSN